jgi:kumamolisin
MAFEKRVRLTGSERELHPNCELIGPVPPDEPVAVTIYLRRKGSDPAISLEPGAGQPRLSRAEFAELHGASPQDITLVEAFAHEYNLTVMSSNLAMRRVMLCSSARRIMTAFGAELQQYRLPTTGQLFRGRRGAIEIPQELSHCILAVLGLDNRPIARPHFRRPTVSPPAGAFTPPQLATLYNFPSGVTGSIETIGIIELGGGYNTTHLKTYFNHLGITEPRVTAISVDGGQNSPGSSDADAEVMLDIEVAGAVAPGASLAVYFAPNTDQGFVDAVIEAVHDTTHKPSVISISWGGPEDSWTEQARTAMNTALQDAATLGVTVVVAAGDSGSSDGVGDGKLHVDFPASSPYALACGGTKMIAAANRIISETVWNETANQEGATGGGVSNAFARPPYQNAAQVPKNPQTQFAGRGVPDISADADPSTGYYVFVDGQNQVIGGTSAVAPLWAGLIALINEHIGSPAGFINPKLYSLPASVFHDITSGNNDDSNLGYYTAGPGWDACTGLGTPDGTAILNALTAGTSSAERFPLPGSTVHHSAAEGFTPLTTKSEKITATILLRRQTESDVHLEEALLSGYKPEWTREQAEQATSASPSEIAAVAAFVREHGLKVLAENRAKRTLHIEGTIEQLESVFGIQMGWVRDAQGHRHLSYKGAISIPKSLSGMIRAVLGLDKRPAAKHATESTRG